MTVRNLSDALLTVSGLGVYHYVAPTAEIDTGAPYAVWGETGITDLSADDGPAEWAVDGACYFYTRAEYDGMFDAICQALADAGIAFRPGRIAWDDVTKTMTYELFWSIEAEPCAIYAEEDEAGDE